MKKYAIVLFLLVSINCSWRPNRRTGNAAQAWENRSEPISFNRDQQDWLNQRRGNNQGRSNTGRRQSNTGTRSMEFHGFNW